MAQTYHLSPQSSNKKTGMGVAVSTTSKDSCPDSCPLKNNGCYASQGPLNIHWTKISSGQRGTDWKGFIEQVEKLPNGWKFRYAQAGDLPGKNEYIDGEKLFELAQTIQKKQLKAWAYSHKTLNKSNVNKIKKANQMGFCINASADNLMEADDAISKGLPTVVVLPSDAPDVTSTVKGHKVIVCPSQTKQGKTCSDCMLCAKSDRKFIIGFKAHGVQYKKAEKVAKQFE
jgi:hypothetical protein